MSFRTRLMLFFLVAVLIPVAILSLLVRREMTSRLTGQYERRAEALVEVIEEEIGRRGDEIESSLSALRRAILDDNRFRRSAVDRVPAERRYLIDWAGEAMRLTGLSMLQVHDGSGRIISSGHFRNEFDRLEPELPRLLAGVPGGMALVRARTPEGPFLALARADSFLIGGERFTMVGGVSAGDDFTGRIVRDRDVEVELVLASGPDGRGAREDAEGEGEGAVVRHYPVLFADTEGSELIPASFRITHGKEELREIRASLDAYFAGAAGLAAVLAVLLAAWLTSRLSRPLADLARKTAGIDLDRLDVDFDTDRDDEIGSLSRLLAAMTDRLRMSAARVRDAERRAAVGELARQVNHDIKNGLAPIRNVLRHLFSLAHSDPDNLPRVLDERRETLESSVGYLEDLAANYSRLYPGVDRRPCDVAEIASRVEREFRGFGRADIKADLRSGSVVRGDPVAIRRIIENLVRNALESLEETEGEVTLRVLRSASGSGIGRVRISVSDTGAGMTPGERERIFDDFYTTREGGTGLGLSIVRRLVMDLGGTIDLDTEKGRGSTFIIDLPAEEKDVSE